MIGSLTVPELEKLLDDYELLFLYQAPASEEPIKHWWAPPGHEPFVVQDAERSRFPDQASVFWQLCHEQDKPPTQAQFCNGFYHTYKSVAEYAYLWEDAYTKKGVEARVRRTYPSFIREYHLWTLLADVFGRDNVRSDVGLDLRGVDFNIQYQGVWFPIRTYVATRRSEAFAEEKGSSRHSDSGKTKDVIDLKLSMRDAAEVGCFKLYKMQHVLDLRKAMDARLQSSVESDRGDDGGTVGS